MPKIFGASVVCLPVVALVGLSLAGCGGSSTTSSAGSASNTPSSQSPTTPPSSASSAATSSGAASTGSLSKAEFISRMDAACAVTDTKRKALPTPTGPTDYLNISANLRGTLLLFPPFISQAEALVGQSADKAELTAKWISLEKSDFAASKSIAQQMVAASNAKDAANVQKIGAELDAAPDHSKGIASFMTAYGLTACATLESS